jgi:Skp family chaperone for outer membrane proteins
LVNYRNQLVETTDKLQKALDTKANSFEQDYSTGIFSKKAAEEKYAALEAEQQEIFKRRQEDEQKMLRSREDLYLPIFTQVEKAIKEVGKAQIFAFIFDSSFYNAILYVESEDVSEAVKKQMAL